MSASGQPLATKNLPKMLRSRVFLWLSSDSFHLKLFQVVSCFCPCRSAELVLGDAHSDTI